MAYVDEFDNFLATGTIDGERGQVGTSDVVFVTCPGHHLHTKGQNSHDCYVAQCAAELDGIRWLYCYCFHSSCQDARKDWIRGINKKFVRSLNRPSAIIKKPIRQGTTGLVKGIVDGAKALSKIEPIEVPAAVFAKPMDDFLWYLNTMWKDGDTIFLGGAYESENHLYKVGDRSEYERLGRNKTLPNFTTPFSFKEGSQRRLAANVLDKRYTVLECDGCSKELQWSLLQYIEKRFNTKLLMAVDTGGKSIHGWFSYGEWILPNKSFLTTLGFDYRVFAKSITLVRTPGIYREEKQNNQRIIYTLDQHNKT